MKKAKFSRYLILVWVIGAIMWGGLVGPLHAFELTVTPSRLDLAVEPGQLLEGTIQVGGRFDRPTRVRLRTGDWEMDPEGQLVFDQPGKNPRSLAKWLSVAPVEFILGKDRVQTIRYRLKAPEEITGGYWGVIFIETVPEPPQPGGGANVGIGISARLAVLVYAETKRGSARDGRITEVRARWAERCLYMEADFLNLGNTMARLKGRFEVRDPVANKVVAKVPFEDLSVLPGMKRRIKAEWQEGLAPGTYLVVAIVDFGGRNLVAGQKTVKVA